MYIYMYIYIYICHLWFGPELNGCHFEIHFIKEKLCCLICITMTFVPKDPINNKSSLYPPNNEVVGGVYWFHSFRPSVRPSICPTSRVRSVAPTVLVGSIAYSYILSSNFRRCVGYKVFFAKFKNLNFWHFFLNLWLWLCLLLTWDLMWITSMGNHGAAGGISECRRSSCSSFNRSQGIWLDNFLKFVTLTLSCLDLGSDVIH